MKKELMNFILSILDKTFNFLKKLKCSVCCCNSNCSIDKSVNVECKATCDKEDKKELVELRKNKSESSLDSLKSR
tara:strand:+ start:351 stop:575 length:225 start_codon:yes stop_codon:yes gene_type:complete